MTGPLSHHANMDKYRCTALCWGLACSGIEQQCEKGRCYCRFNGIFLLVLSFWGKCFCLNLYLRIIKSDCVTICPGLTCCGKDVQARLDQELFSAKGLLKTNICSRISSRICSIWLSIQEYGCVCLFLLIISRTRHCMKLNRQVYCSGPKDM